MGQHPLIELASSRDVKQAAAFRQAAGALSGERLASLFEREVAAAPQRHDVGKKYLVRHNQSLASRRRVERDGEHAALALVHYCRSGARLALPPTGTEGGPEDDTLELVHALVPLKSGQVDKARGVDDPNRGVERLDALAVGPDARLGVVVMRFLAPEATRVRVGDTPLRALLQGLANCAIATANREALQSELAAAGRRMLAEGPPVLALIGSPRYWELCRKREAQKGAGWIKEMERLAGEIEREIGLSVRYLALRLQGNPGWSYPDQAPVLDAPPELAPAWEAGAGRVRPKPKPRPRPAEAQDLVVPPDLSRPIRPYGVTETFHAGDRIDHPKLGIGVVQGGAGPGKIRVLFDGRVSLLVHEREAPRTSG